MFSHIVSLKRSQQKMPRRTEEHLVPDSYLISFIRMVGLSRNNDSLDCCVPSTPATPFHSLAKTNKKKKNIDAVILGTAQFRNAAWMAGLQHTETQTQSLFLPSDMITCQAKQMLWGPPATRKERRYTCCRNQYSRNQPPHSELENSGLLCQ